MYQYTGFKLISLSLRGNSLMGKSKLDYSFIDPTDKQESIYTTVIIGSNGTGKSNLFRIIIELLKELYDLSKEKSRSYNVDGLFNLKFSVDGDIFEYANFDITSESGETGNEVDKNNQSFLLRNAERIDFKDAQFPFSIVANSIMLTDKFPFYRKEKDQNGDQVDGFPIYKYLGVRNIPQSASTRAYIRRTVEFIVEQFEKKNNNASFLGALKRATDFLELENSIEIFYYTSNNAKFFKGDLTSDALENYFDSIHKKYPKPEDNPPFKLNQYLKIKDDKILIKSLCEFCNELVSNDRLEKLPYKYSSIRKINYDLLDAKSFEKLNNEYSMLEYLRQLGMISSPEIQLRRAGGYSLQESSSGEYHFFSSVVGLMATVKPTNSLVLIDEPEISLHPNWQMKYLTFVRELFNQPEYATCHFLVATHSHFLISDLKGDNSKIIGLKRVNGSIETVEMPENLDTYCWSPDDVLYNIFNVTSSRNSFVAEEIAKILDELAIGNKDEMNKIEPKIYTTLLELREKLKDNDPLKEVVKSILKKIN